MAFCQAITIEEASMSIQQQFLSKPAPHPHKIQLKELGITAGAVASYVGLSYPYVVNMLNGAHPMTRRTDLKIQKLIREVKAING